MSKLMRVLDVLQPDQLERSQKEASTKKKAKVGDILCRAQVAYDLREKWEFCSGLDLHDFFDDQTGHPSPSGYHFIRLQSLKDLVWLYVRDEKTREEIYREIDELRLKEA